MGKIYKKQPLSNGLPDRFGFVRVQDTHGNVKTTYYGPTTDDDKFKQYYEYWFREITKSELELIRCVEELLRFKHEIRSQMSSSLLNPDNFITALDNLIEVTKQ